MAGLLDQLGLSGLGNRFDKFSRDPLGMASLGLLLQPRRRPVGASGFDYAMQGMQTAAANKRNQLYEQQMAQEDELRKEQYRLRAMQYAQEMQQRAAAEEQARRQALAEEDYVSSLPPEQQALARAMGGGSFAKISAESMLSPTAQGSTPADLQKYEYAKSQGYPGTFMQFMSEMRPAPSPIYSAIPTAQGLMSYNQRTGRVENVSPGVLPAAQDPALAGQRAEATAAGTTTGQAQAQAQLGFPQYESIANETISRIDELITHPGMRGAVGAPSPGKAMAFVPGTEQSNFMSLLNSVKGRQFLEAFESLKGGGQITEVEGQKATQAISDMSTAQSEEAFVRSANQFRNIVQKGLERARRKALVGNAQRGTQTTTPSGVSVQPQFIDFQDLP